MKALHNISYGVFILTAKTHKHNGCVINTLVQLTSKPKQVAITVNKDNFTTKQIEESGIFNVSILDNTATFDIIKHFGFSSGKDVDKFENFFDFKVSSNNLAYITKYTNAFISCRITQKIDVGTHFLFVADVTEEEVLNQNPSLTYSEYQSKIKPQPQTKGAYVCKICGYVFEGQVLPENFVCPICKHGKEDFEYIKK